MGFNALWWWIDRWRKSTAFTDMTLEEQGAYRNLLDEATLRGGAIPNDERILAKACGDALAWKRVKAVVLARFELRQDGWRNETLDEVLRESTRRKDNQKKWREKRKGSGSDNTAGLLSETVSGLANGLGSGLTASLAGGLQTDNASGLADDNGRGLKADSPYPSPGSTYDEEQADLPATGTFGRKITAAGASASSRARTRP